VSERIEELARTICAQANAERSAEVGRAAAAEFILACFKRDRQLWIEKAHDHLASVASSRMHGDLPVRMWKLIKEEGHRYYSNDMDDEIALSDWSARAGKPWTSDDGLLFLDRSRPILRNSSGSYSIPVKNPAGNKSWTVGSAYEAIFLKEKLFMRAEDRTLNANASAPPQAHPRGRWTEGE